MIVLQIACAGIVAAYLVLRLRDASRWAVLRKLALLAIASFIGEDTMIRAYGYYTYSPEWSLFVDRVPFLVVAIWPIVIDSAALLAGRIVGSHGRATPWLAAGFVLADASLIEPIAVKAGLWSWAEGGLFAVPPVGILGWAFFAYAAVATLERARAGSLVVLVAPASAHALVVASWWGAFRWLRGPIPSWVAVACAWSVAAPLAVLAWRRAIRARVPFGETLVRVPGAVFFFYLLAVHGRDAPALAAYAFAFVPPYMALVAWPRRPVSR